MSVKTTLPFTYGSLDTEISLHQLTTQEKEVLRKREKTMTQTEYKFVFAPWDLCIKTLAALKLTGGWPLKRKY